MVASIGSQNFICHIAMSHFDLVCSRLHGLIKTCISERVAFNVAAPFNMLIKRSGDWQNNMLLILNIYVYSQLA